MKKDSKEVSVGEEVPVAVDRKDVEQMMGLREFMSTNTLSLSGAAGFAQFCSVSKMPPRMTATQWRNAYNNWLASPVPA